MCDMDENCKGYVKEFGSCQIATTSTCSAGCHKLDTGVTGSLVIDSNHPLGSDYEGCFIKFGKLTHHMKIFELMNYGFVKRYIMFLVNLFL